MRQIESPFVHPFAGFDIPALVAARAASHPDKPWLVWEPFGGPREVWTFGEFAHEVDCVAAGLAARGIAAGDSVLVHLDNCPEILFAWFACARIGAICVTTNARSAADEMTYFADHSGAVAAITQPKFAAMIGSRLQGPALGRRDRDRQRRGAGSRQRAGKWTGRGQLRPAGGRSGRCAMPAGRPDGAAFGPVHLRHDIAAQGGAVAARQRPVGRQDECRPRGPARDRQPPDLPADLPHQRPGLFRARLAVGGRGLRGPAALFGQPVLGRGGAQRLHLDQHGAVHEPGADGFATCRKAIPSA